MLPIPATQLNGAATLGHYWTFYRAVAAAQLKQWLPKRPVRVADVSGGHGRWSAQAALAGHTVIEVHDFRRADNDRQLAGVGPVGTVAQGPGALQPGPVARVRAEGLRFLDDRSVDAVLAEERTLSVDLVTETLVAEIARVLRPGGRVLACVDSLVLGMAILAEQQQWAHLRLTEDVMLVPWPDGSITRCFSAAHLHELFAGAGLVVEWIRPRTVLSPSTVDHVLGADSRALPWLVRTELATRPDGDDTVGIHLLVSARRP
ncbi:methyltransferase domain-containing protein [Bailinhaonella thermotolerans]|uniref:Methyltransferase domain-containing protein n=1 Tax=Bailinhaonella thermotolerans TaxID=1070861 RepID=A0A3A4AH81_9ACTN|nr:methyltransferase domain-containing protein [Bailinhaonella thermotolerans]RJL25190.1 methyltransferase domain-containing protein [Bailinhaonella thermotolerans]